MYVADYVVLGKYLSFGWFLEFKRCSKRNYLYYLRLLSAYSFRMCEMTLDQSVCFYYKLRERAVIVPTELLDVCNCGTVNWEVNCYHNHFKSY